jgi:L-ascorbate metabolism protein UlaG (beta-lactamase superfamily)
MVTVRWTGAAGLEFSHEARTVLLDPYLSRKGKIDLFFRRLSPEPAAIDDYVKRIPGRVSAMIVSHTHFDHVLDVPDLARRFPVPLVGSRSLDTLMGMYDMQDRVRVCEGGERVDLPGGDVLTMILSRHGRVALGRVPFPGEIKPEGGLPLKAGAYGHGTVFLPRLEMGGRVFLVAGSADFIESELEGQGCDVLFLCVPGWKRVPEFTTRLPALVKPRIIVPFHYDDFTRPLARDLTSSKLPFQDLPGFLDRLSKQAPDAEVRLIDTFEAMNL